MVGRQVGGVVAQVSICELGEKDTTPVSRIGCECGKRAEYKVKRARGIVTLCGTVTVLRAYCYRPHCKRGYTPGDRRQGFHWEWGERQRPGCVDLCLCGEQPRLTWIGDRL